MINLIYNKDIKELESKASLTPNELTLLPLKNALETKIQELCHNTFKQLSFDLERKYGKKVVEFIHVDNGGKMGIRQKMKKKAEGVKAGIPDVSLFCGSPCGQYSKVILVEFKRIGTPSQIDISEEQQYYYDWFNSIGFKAYITNNPVFFKDVICKEVTDFFDSITK